ncbi:helix-turn-helix domain-containing protein [Agrobacterium larrymoorei]|uniref:Excisionase family DNA binding protein n=1 Tax=Agrobacterium larrymoorei TaxID=160699 RepID=A0ABU0UID0_9HYPH|nr:helix-turn-helix domain-containing protein [Agrobacterium larrymoorei]MDQ1184708.1 excisionase family DNA binding protein [Agrobacterium larrymoorei]
MKDTPIEKLAFSIPEAAQKLSISRASLYLLIKAGTIRPIKILGRTVLTEAELRRFLSSLSGDAA